MSRGRTIFRGALVVGLVWSAWPTVAAAVGGSSAAPTPTAAAPVPVTLPPPTTVALPEAPAPTLPPVTEAPVTTQPTAAEPTAAPTSPPPPTAAPSAVSPPTEAVAIASASCSTGPVIDAINRDRIAAGVGALCADGGLAALAQDWANQLAAAGPLAHRDLQSVIVGSGFGVLGENLLAGPTNQSPADMEAAWMASPRHAENCIRSVFTVAGVGIAYGGGRVYVVVDFGG